MRLGLTGGIGSGKSTAAQLLAAMGWTLVDTDAIARRLPAERGPALNAIAARFGPGVLTETGELNRPALRQHVFNDSAAKADLEAVLHPLILQDALQQAAGQAWVVFDVPLLAESAHWRTRVDRVLVLDCDVEVQVQRVAQRPGWTAEQARSVIALQASRSHRRSVADAVIDNTCLSMAELRLQLEALSQVWQGPVEESAV
jgi:dephospho-CoA kinase